MENDVSGVQQLHFGRTIGQKHLPKYSAFFFPKSRLLDTLVHSVLKFMEKIMSKRRGTRQDSKQPESRIYLQPLLKNSY